SGTWPKVAVQRNERPIAGTPLYVSVGSEFNRLLRGTNNIEDGRPVETNDSFNRVDINPQIRFPFKKWQFLTANSTVSWRDTYYTRSYTYSLEEPTTINTQLSNQSLNRPVFTIQSQVLGPVFNRIWDTPQNGYAEKFKHSVEPYVTITKTADVPNYLRVPQFDGIDYYVGGTQYNYGIANRIYAKRRLTPGQPAQAREIIAVNLTQTYYTNQIASLRDRSYQTSATGDTRPNHFSPIAL